MLIESYRIQFTNLKEIKMYPKLEIEIYLIAITKPLKSSEN